MQPTKPHSYLSSVSLLVYTYKGSSILPIWVEDCDPLLVNEMEDLKDAEKGGSLCLCEKYWQPTLSH